MEKRVQVHRLLGLPRRASVGEMEQRCEALLDWFESDEVPENVRPWIAGPTQFVQEIYDGLGSQEAPATTVTESSEAAAMAKVLV